MKFKPFRKKLHRDICYRCSVAQSCSTLCESTYCSMPGFPVLHHLLELAQTYVYWVSDVIQPSHPLLSPFSSCPQSFPASGFPMSQLFASGGHSIGASASVLSMNIHSWFPLGLTGLISLQARGLSRAFSSTTVQRHQFFGVHPFLSSSSYLYMTTGKTIALPRQTFVGEVMSLLTHCLVLSLLFFQGTSIF